MGMCININHNDYNGHINHRETFGGIFGTWFEWFIMVSIFFRNYPFGSPNYGGIDCLIISCLLFVQHLVR